MMNVFDPARHKVVAVDAEGQHIHVDLGELKADMAELEAGQQPVSSEGGTLALAVALAAYAIQNGVQAGDFYWHGGSEPFEWDGRRYDAPGIIEYARRQL
jgi:hypothetical protein